MGFFFKAKEIKKELVYEGYKTIEGWLTPLEAKGLFETASCLQKDGVAVEIGSWKGKSTYCIAQGMKAGGTVYCIDPFNADGETGSKEIYEATKGSRSLLEQFKNNLKNIPQSVKIQALEGYAKEFVGVVKCIDFLFIDGDHSIQGCRFDFESFAPFVKQGGFVAFHDYDPARPELGPTWVVDNLVRRDFGFASYRSYDSLVIFKKLS